MCLEDFIKIIKTEDPIVYLNTRGISAADIEVYKNEILDTIVIYSELTTITLPRSTYNNKSIRFYQCADLETIRELRIYLMAADIGEV